MKTAAKNAGRTVEPRERKMEDVRIEYPKNGEKISGPEYTIHLSVQPEISRVDVSIDGGEWMPCRESLGLWWFDWSGYGAGPHQVLARARRAEGDVSLSQPREVFVAL